MPGDSMDFHAIRGLLDPVGCRLAGPASLRCIERFERTHGVALIEPVRSNYLIMNGSDYFTRNSWMRFWPLEEWRPAKDESFGKAAGTFPAKSLICADYAIDCIHYVIDLTPGSSTLGYVFGIGANHAGIAGRTFPEFIENVVNDSDGLHSYG